MRTSECDSSETTEEKVYDFLWNNYERRAAEKLVLCRHHHDCLLFVPLTPIVWGKSEQRKHSQKCNLNGFASEWCREVLNGKLSRLNFAFNFWLESNESFFSLKWNSRFVLLTPLRASSLSYFREPYFVNPKTRNDVNSRIATNRVKVYRASFSAGTLRHFKVLQGTRML